MSATARLAGAAGLAALVLLTGCAQRRPPLYTWEDFPRQQYQFLLREGANPQDQILALEAQAAKASGSESGLPPGFRAHLGMLYLGAGNAGRASELWTAEKSVFPESAPYMDRLLAKLNAPAAATQSTTTTKEKPL